MTTISFADALRRHKPLAIMLALALSLGAVGIAGAASAPSTKVFYACVNTSTRLVRLVPASTPCRSGEARRSWNRVGPVGPQGPAGAAGAAGQIGPQGPAGQDGTDGLDGTNGTDGLDGTNGTDGLDGTNGTDGLDGTNGTDGLDGTNGIDGIDGTVGPQGPIGPEGPQGIPGQDGTNGTNGTDGTDGTDGAPGPQGPAGSIGFSHVVHGPTVPHDKNTIEETVSVSCDSGEIALGGGGLMTTTDSADTIHLSSSYPSDPNTWTVTASGKVAPGKVWTIRAYVVCMAS